MWVVDEEGRGWIRGWVNEWASQWLNEQHDFLSDPYNWSITSSPGLGPDKESFGLSVLCCFLKDFSDCATVMVKQVWTPAAEGGNPLSPGVPQGAVGSVQLLQMDWQTLDALSSDIPPVRGNVPTQSCKITYCAQTLHKGRGKHAPEQATPTYCCWNLKSTTMSQPIQ